MLMSIIGQCSSWAQSPHSNKVLDGSVPLACMQTFRFILNILQVNVFVCMLDTCWLVKDVTCLFKSNIWWTRLQTLNTISCIKNVCCIAAVVDRNSIHVPFSMFSAHEDNNIIFSSFVPQCRSWKTYLTMMHWSMRRQSSWVQLAGHQGTFIAVHPKQFINTLLWSCLQLSAFQGLRETLCVLVGPPCTLSLFRKIKCYAHSLIIPWINNNSLSLSCCSPGNFQLSDGGEVLKLYSEVEANCLESLMGDTLRPFVPQYHGLVNRGEHCYIRLEDLLSGLRRPVIMDCKMGVR